MCLTLYWASSLTLYCVSSLTLFCFIYRFIPVCTCLLPALMGVARARYLGYSVVFGQYMPEDSPNHTHQLFFTFLKGKAATRMNLIIVRPFSLLDPTCHWDP